MKEGVVSVYEVSWICNFPEEGSNGHELASLASSLNVNRLSDTHATTCQIGTVAGEPEVRRNYCVRELQNEDPSFKSCIGCTNCTVYCGMVARLVGPAKSMIPGSSR